MGFYQKHLVLYLAMNLHLLTFVFISSCVLVSKLVPGYLGVVFSMTLVLSLFECLPQEYLYPFPDFSFSTSLQVLQQNSVILVNKSTILTCRCHLKYTKIRQYHLFTLNSEIWILF